MTPKNLNDLYINQLRDLYSAESQLLEALPKLADEATSPELENAFRTHLEETKAHLDRLQQIFEDLDESPRGRSCYGMKGLIKEARDFISDASSLFGQDAPDVVLDAGLIMSAQRVEHYEIAGYGTLATYADMLGRPHDKNLLNLTLIEERQADKTLTRLAEQGINMAAVRA